MHTYSFRTRLTWQVPGVSLAIISLAGLLTISTAHASIECLVDDEAVVQCEAIAFTQEHQLRARQATCKENCAICGLEDLTEFETN